MSEFQTESAQTELPVEPELPLPGAALRAAREAQGLSLAEISQALKFGVRQLEALENDDYSTLKGATFIRGFVRSYARYLRLDEAPLLAALEPRAPVAVAEVKPVESMGAEMPTGVADGSKRTYWLAAAVLVLGAVAWFAWQGQPAMPSKTEVAAPSSASVAESDSSPVAAPAPVKLPETVSAPTATSGSEAAAPSTSAVESDASATPDGVPPIAPANANERQLVLSFGGVSWVEVRDASQRVLYSGNSTPDSRQTLRGRPPFQLVIGNAQAVKLRYEDRSIDLQPYTRVDVARLTLDDNTK